MVKIRNMKSTAWGCEDTPRRQRTASLGTDRPPQRHLQWGELQWGSRKARNQHQNTSRQISAITNNLLPGTKSVFVFFLNEKAFTIQNGQKTSFEGRFTHWNPRPEPARWPTSPTLSSPCSPVRSSTQLPATTFNLSALYEEANLYIRGLWRQVRGRGGCDVISDEPKTAAGSLVGASPICVKTQAFWTQCVFHCI